MDDRGFRARLSRRITPIFNETLVNSKVLAPAMLCAVLMVACSLPSSSEGPTPLPIPRPTSTPSTDLALLPVTPQPPVQRPASPTVWAAKMTGLERERLAEQEGLRVFPLGRLGTGTVSALAPLEIPLHDSGSISVIIRLPEDSLPQPAEASTPDAYFDVDQQWRYFHASIAVYTSMRASLSTFSGATITADHPESGILNMPFEGEAIWNWHVTPSRPGYQWFTVSISLPFTYATPDSRAEVELQRIVFYINVASPGGESPDGS